jgi:hypothetical protein
MTLSSSDCTDPFLYNNPVTDSDVRTEILKIDSNAWPETQSQTIFTQLDGRRMERDVAFN